MENIESNVMEIVKGEAELNKIEMEVKELETKRLNKVAQIAKNGLKYEKIYQEKITYNNNNNYREDKVIYLKDENGKYIKGVYLYTNEISCNKDLFGGKSEDNLLYLLQDGTFKVFKRKSNWSNSQECSSEYTKTIAECQELSQFGYDEIVTSIKEELEDRLKELGDRSKTQKERLEKLKKLEINN